MNKWLYSFLIPYRNETNRVFLACKDKRKIGKFKLKFKFKIFSVMAKITREIQNFES